MTRLECSNEQTEDVILQTLPFYSLEDLSSDVFKENEGVFEKHESCLQRLLIEKTTIYDEIQEKLEEGNMKQAVNEVLKTLTERERKVIRERFGFDNGEEKTLEQVGRDFGVTRERVRQIESKVLKKLCHPTRQYKLKGFI